MMHVSRSANDDSYPCPEWGAFLNLQLACDITLEDKSNFVP